MLVSGVCLQNIRNERSIRFLASMIFLVNKYKHVPTPNDVYIGRGSPLGNPFTGSKKLSETKALVQCDTPEIAIAAYREYLYQAIINKDKAICQELNRIWQMAKYGDVYLVCFCAPKPCHGLIIKHLIESKL
jgi:hypothetical protein